MLIEEIVLKSKVYLKRERDFPGGPVSAILHSQGRGLGSIPGGETRSHMPKLKIQCCSKDLGSWVPKLRRPGAAK